MIKFVLLIAICTSQLLAQDADVDDLWNFAGNNDEIIVEVRVETPVVRPGETVKGDCVVTNEADQTSFQFEIVRKTQDSEEILSNTADFSFVADSPQQLEGLFCRATRGASYATEAFSVTMNEESEVTFCKPNERQCADESKCYLIQKQCDGFNDCPDASDETGCNCDPAIRSCGPSRNGQQPSRKTFNVNWECDGENDCGNNYDEEDCGAQNKVASCFPNSRYTCRNSNRTIPSAYLCDGSFECESRDDEERCPTQLSFQKSFEPVERSVTVGDTVTLKCTISAYPPPRVIWRFNWRCLMGQETGASQTPYFGSRPNPRYEVSSTVTGCQSGLPTVVAELTIRSIQLGDAGIFNCEGLLGAKRPMGEDMVVIVRNRY